MCKHNIPLKKKLSAKNIIITYNGLTTYDIKTNNLHNYVVVHKCAPAQ